RRVCQSHERCDRAAAQLREGSMRHRFALVVTAFLIAACGSSSGNAATSPSPLGGTVNVFAAASLTAAFNALGTSFQGANSGVSVKFNFAGTPTLVTQIKRGAHAEVV